MEKEKVKGKATPTYNEMERIINRNKPHIFLIIERVRGSSRGERGGVRWRKKEGKVRGGHR